MPAPLPFPSPLPIDAHVAAAVAAVRRHRALVLIAPPGAGKTTRLPAALAADEATGPVILLQPRRVAARAIARRIAAERGWTLGEEVGWQVRFERRFTARTRLLVATEGILTARLQADPLLAGFRTVVLDEFHERSLHGDLALALARQAARARDDLALVVMSATLDPGAIAAFLGDDGGGGGGRDGGGGGRDGGGGGCPVIVVDARAHPVAIEHAPGIEMAEAARRALASSAGDVLCFLPGAGEIRRAASALAGTSGVDVLPLHGSLDADAQDRALAPSARRKVVLATNLAETSLTVEGVTTVIDSGLERVLRLDPAKGIDRLEVERISRDSADQRAGRAGRTGPGRAIRLWDPRDTLRPHREPEIRRVDLSAAMLEVLAWGGGDPADFAWFEPPPPEIAQAALELLTRLGATDAHRRLTPLGEQIRRFPLHPRLARVLIAAGGSRQAAAACALLSERDFVRGEALTTTDCDVLTRLDRMREASPGVRQVAGEIHALAGRILGSAGGEPDDDERLRRALLAGFPDRVAERREPGSPRLLLASGAGAVLARESGVRDAELLVALDLQAGARGAGSEALVRLASAVERGWLAPTAITREHRLEDGRVRAYEVERCGAIVLRERPAAADPEESARMLVAAWRARGPSDAERRLLLRLAFAGLAAEADAGVDALLARSAQSARKLDDVHLGDAIPPDVRARLDALAPDSLLVPSGRRHRLDYDEHGAAVLAVKLQELFGLAETPRIGPRKEPVTLSLLSPSGRPVQTTRDLRSFWDRTYPEVRKELRARYPRHPWPEDPWSAPATARTKPKPKPKPKPKR